MISPIDPTKFTPQFRWHESELACEAVPLANIAERYGTPAYVYSAAAISANYHSYARAFGKMPSTICYSVKANSNLAILRFLSKLGSGFDIVSGGELYRLQRAGVSTRRIVYSGVGKTREEMREALSAGILLFNVESEQELEILESEAARIGRRAPAAIRVNPDVAAKTHHHIATGRHHHKFGMDWADARRVYRRYRESRWIDWKGISAHIGSQILDLPPVRRVAETMAGFVRELRRDGIAIEYVDLGGGLGIRYTNEKPPPVSRYAAAIVPALKPLGCRLLLEPGRSIVGAAGILLTRVIYTKMNRGKLFVIVDAAMSDFIRPALYDAVHPITKATRGRAGEKIVRADIVGPVCESGDCFLHDWPIREVRPGDLLVLWGAGAYGFVESSNFNSRPRPAEIFVQGRKARIVRRKESRTDLVRGESA